MEEPDILNRRSVSQGIHGNAIRKPKVWTKPSTVLKSVGPKLVPFFKTVAVYFVLFIPQDKESWFAVIVKCAPILSLIIFVLLHGMSLGDEFQYSRRILLGLIASCLGDAFLIYKDYLVPGIAAFGIAQIMYISAFTFKPLNLPAGICVYSVCLIGCAFIVPNTNLFIGPIVFSYIFLLGTSLWRAVARVQLFEDLWTWTKLCSCVGGVLFVLSDALLGFSMFVVDLPYKQTLVMVTYYAAQFGIALSVVDSKAAFIAENPHALQKPRSSSRNFGSLLKFIKSQ